MTRIRSHVHSGNSHWKCVPHNTIGASKTAKVVRPFKCKCQSADDLLLKHKAHLYVHWRIQIYGGNYWDAYAPKVNWVSIRGLLVISILLNMHTRIIDFTLTFPQANADVTIYMEMPFGFELPDK